MTKHTQTCTTVYLPGSYLGDYFYRTLLDMSSPNCLMLIILVNLYVKAEKSVSPPDKIRILLYVPNKRDDNADCIFCTIKACEFDEVKVRKSIC